MSDQQKFMEAYDMLANLAKKNPLMSKLWTDAQITLLKEAKEIYFALKNEAADDSKAKVQTVAYKKPNPDPSPDPDDDDPNTIKKKEFVSEVLEIVGELRKNISSDVKANSDKISLTFIENYASKTANPVTPIGKVFWSEVANLSKNTKNETVGTFAGDLDKVLAGYKKENLTKHYAENKSAYIKKGIEDGEVDVNDLLADIPTDTGFIIKAAEAYAKEENIRGNDQKIEMNKEAFVQHATDFLNELILGLENCKQENFAINIPNVLETWRKGFEIKVKGNFQPFLPLLDGVKNLGETTTASAFYYALKSIRDKEFSAEKLEAIAPQCVDCDFRAMLPLERAKHYAAAVLNEKNALQDALIAAWIKRQSEWYQAIINDSAKVENYAVVELKKDVAADFKREENGYCVANIWYQSFSQFLAAVKTQTLTSGEMAAVVKNTNDKLTSKEFAEEFKICSGTVGTNISQLVNNLDSILPVASVFAKAAKYKSTNVVVNVDNKDDDDLPRPKADESLSFGITIADPNPLIALAIKMHCMIPVKRTKEPEKNITKAPLYEPYDTKALKIFEVTGIKNCTIQRIKIESINASGEQIQPNEQLTKNWTIVVKVEVLVEEITFTKKGNSWMLFLGDKTQSAGGVVLSAAMEISKKNPMGILGALVAGGIITVAGQLASDVGGEMAAGTTITEKNVLIPYLFNIDMFSQDIVNKTENLVRFAIDRIYAVSNPDGTIPFKLSGHDVMELRISLKK